MMVDLVYSQYNMICAVCYYLYACILADIACY